MASAEWIATWQKRVQEVLQQAGVTESTCPVCDGTKNVALPFVTAPWADEPGYPFNADGLLLLPLLCDKCKHVRLFFAGGLAKVAEDAAKEEGK